MTDKRVFVEIGNGEDLDINWHLGFEILNDIDSILDQYETVGKHIDKNALVKILDELRDMAPFVPFFDNFHEAFDLIKGAVRIEKKLFDPEMPTSSFWKKITVEDTQVKTLLLFLNHAKKVFRQLYERDGIPRLITKSIEKNAIDLKSKQEKNSQSTGLGFETQVKELLSKLDQILQNKSGVHHHHPYLINQDEGIIFVLTVHTSYRKLRSELEKTITALLKKDHKVYEIKESIKPEGGYIPHFSGKKRLKEMGWEQNRSILHHQDELILELAKKSRSIHIKNLEYKQV